MNALGAWNRWDRIDEHLLLGAKPSRRDVARLAALGVRAVVNLCEEFAGYGELLERQGIRQLHLPTIDYTVPTAEDLVRGMRFTAQQVADGRAVYLHCKAGRGRSAILAVCHLMAHRNVSAAEAYHIVKTARPHINAGIDKLPVVRVVERKIRDRSLTI